MPQIFDGSPKPPFFEARHSVSSITDIHVPKYLSMSAFMRLTNMSKGHFGTYVSYGQLRLKVIDGIHFVELDSPVAKSLLPSQLRTE
jgi:hypothetical protein